MGVNTMKITFVGAVLVIAIVLAAVLLLQSTKPLGDGAEPPSPDSQI